MILKFFVSANVSCRITVRMFSFFVVVCRKSQAIYVYNKGSCNVCVVSAPTLFIRNFSKENLRKVLCDRCSDVSHRCATSPLFLLKSTQKSRCKPLCSIESHIRELIASIARPPEPHAHHTTIYKSQYSAP